MISDSAGTWYFDPQTFLDDVLDKNYAKEWGLWTGDRDVKGPPRLQFIGNGTSYAIGNNGLPFQHDDKNLIFKDNLSWRRGTHNLNLGGDFLHQNMDWLYDNQALGLFEFGRGEGQPGSNRTVTGSVFADVLLGLAPRQAYSVQPAKEMKYRRNTFGIWFQDDWKVTPRLTLNLGLRYDYVPPLTQTTNEFVTFNFETATIRFAEGAPENIAALAKYPYEKGGPNQPYQPNKKDFSPRFGFALRPFDNNRTVLRGGYGIFYAAQTVQYTDYGSWVQPFGGSFTYESLPAFSFDRKLRLQTVDKKPIDYDEFIGRTPGTAIVNPPTLPTTSIQQWNFALEHEVIAQKLVAEAAYVGSKGSHLGTPESLLTYNAGLVPTLNSVYKGTWGGPTLFTQTSNSKFHSLQGKVKGDFGGGLNFLASYTFGKAVAEASNEDYNPNLTVDLRTNLQYDVRRQYSLADFDVRHRFVLSGSYLLPFGRNRKFGSNWSGALDAILGGWEGHWIAVSQSGIPWAVLSTSGYIPDRTCDGNLPSSERSVQRWFDRSCFADHRATIVANPDVPGTTVTTNYQGNSGLNVIMGPGTNNVDLGIHKNFRATERIQIQFRMEAFNAFNHTNLKGPVDAYTFTNTASGSQITNAGEKRDIQFALKILF